VQEKTEEENKAIFRQAVADTLANEEWWKKNTEAVKKMLPLTWTHIANLEGLKIGFAMKLIGLDWRTQDQFGRIMVFFEKIGVMQRQNVYHVRANPDWAFKPEHLAVEK
jgi:hypothetical protein